MEHTAGPSFVTLGHVVQLCGPGLKNTAALASCVEVRSVRFITHLLNTCRCELTQTELSLLTAHCNRHRQPNNDDPFPALTLVPDFKNLFKTSVESTLLTTITKRVGGLQWRIPHRIVAVNAFISLVNPNVSEKSPFCSQKETVFHCFMDCGRLDSLFQLLQRIFTMLAYTFSMERFILGYPYLQKKRLKCQLINFILGQAKMVIYLSRRNKLENSLDVGSVTLLVRMVKARLHGDFSFYRTTNNVEEFFNIWSLNNVLCSVVENELIFGLVLS